MTPPVRVIQLLLHSPWYFRNSTRPMDEEAMLNDWHFRTAYYLHHHFSDRFMVECWRPDWCELQEKIVTVKGIKCRIFPSRRPPLGEFAYELSLPMLAKLWNEAQRGRFVLHVHGVPCLTGILASLLGSNVIKVAHNHGSLPIRLYQRKDRPAWKRLILQTFMPIEEFSFRRYDHIFVTSEKGLKYIKNCTPLASKLTMGVDFSAFSPRNKGLAREKLGLPARSRIVLYIGRFYRLKRVDNLLCAMDEVRQLVPNAFLLAIGGLPQDDLYQEVIARADRALAPAPHGILQEYIAASDLYVYPSSLRFGGIGIAPLEAMAMNIPIISAALTEIPCCPDERVNLGITYDPSQDSLAQLIVQAFTYLDQYSPRDVVARYYDWSVIASEIARIYDTHIQNRWPDLASM